ncbi:MAG: AI-2E family transporter [Geodermatophilaceae bacterium]|nr:AI-2E family transporter [Geodermatophilaceae bacterium]
MIGEGIYALARWSAGLIAIAVAAVIIGYIIGRLWVVVLPALLALIVATVAWPPARWLRSKGWPPAAAAVTVVLAALAALVATVGFITPPVAAQIGDIAANAADGLTQVQRWVTGPPLNLSEDQVSALRESITERLQNSATVIASGLLTGVSTVTSFVVGVVVVLFLTFFFVKDGPRLLPWLRATLGEEAGTHLEAILLRAWRSLGAFIRSQAVVGAVDGALIGVGLLILGVPLALPLAVLTFFAGFVPIIGAVIAGSLAFLVALVTKGFGTALIVLAIVVAVQQIEGNVLQPVLQGKTLRLHQAVILLSVTAGGTLFGITGAFFAVPVVAVGAEVLRYLGEQIDSRRTQVLIEAGEATMYGPEPGPEPEPEPDAHPSAW